MSDNVSCGMAPELQYVQRDTRNIWDAWRTHVSDTRSLGVARCLAECIRVPWPILRKARIHRRRHRNLSERVGTRGAKNAVLLIIQSCYPECAHTLPNSYPSIRLMGIDGGARLERAFVHANRVRRGIRADIVGVGAVHEVAVRSRSVTRLGLCWLPILTARFPYDIQSNLRNGNDYCGEQRQKNFPFVTPTRALRCPPCRCPSTYHAKEGIEYCYDCPFVANVARRVLRGIRRARQLRKFLVGRGARSGQQGDHIVCQWIERRVSRPECSRGLLRPRPS